MVYNRYENIRQGQQADLWLMLPGIFLLMIGAPVGLGSLMLERPGAVPGVCFFIALIGAVLLVFRFAMRWQLRRERFRNGDLA